MHTEHLANVRPARVAMGWFMGAALFSLLFFGLVSTGVLNGVSGGGGWLLLAMFVGYGAAGWMVGRQAGAAPILHAIFIGLFSIPVWLAANLLGSVFNVSTLNEVSAVLVLSAVLLQVVAAALGALVGSRAARAATRPTS